MAMIVAAACGGCASSRTGHVVLDGRPRYPDTEGVVTAIDVHHVVLDGGRRYGVAKKVQVFSTETLESVPPLGRLNQYVQLGLEGRTMVWMAGVAAVVRAPGRSPTVYYDGTLVRVDGRRRAVFRDGTVLQLAPGVSPPAPSGPMRAEIDPDRHIVRALRAD